MVLKYDFKGFKGIQSILKYLFVFTGVYIIDVELCQDIIRKKNTIYKNNQLKTDTIL